MKKIKITTHEVNTYSRFITTLIYVFTVVRYFIIASSMKNADISKIMNFKLETIIMLLIIICGMTIFIIPSMIEKKKEDYDLY